MASQCKFKSNWCCQVNRFHDFTKEQMGQHRKHLSEPSLTAHLRVRIPSRFNKKGIWKSKTMYKLIFWMNDFNDFIISMMSNHRIISHCHLTYTPSRNVDLVHFFWLGRHQSLPGENPNYVHWDCFGSWRIDPYNFTECLEHFETSAAW